MARLTDEEFVPLLRKRVEQAISATAENDADRKRAFDAFFCQPTGTEEDDYSSFQSADVNSVITADLAQMSISFGVDEVVSFEPTSAEDEQRARAETRAVNKVLEENGLGQEATAVAQNAEICGSGKAKVWWDEDINVFQVTYDGIEESDLPVLVEDEEGKQRRLISYDAAKRRARIETTEAKRRLRVKAIANERFFYDPDWDERQLDGCGLCGEIHYMTRDQLSRMGVPWEKTKQLPAVIKGQYESDERNRNRLSGTMDPLVMQQDTVVVYEVMARYTREEDEDRTYLYRNWIGQSGDFFLLEPELAARIPYCVGVMLPVANRHEGESTAIKQAPIQDAKTEAGRQWEANTRNASWSRLGVVTNSANVDDVLRPKPGGVIRIKNPDALVPIPVQDVGPSIKLRIDQLNQDRTERGGAVLDMASAPMQVANSSAHATERVFASNETGVSYKLRNFAESFYRDVFVKAHAELRSGLGGPINLKVGEEWTQEDPTQWPERRWCNVNVAPSFGERVHMSNALAMCLQWDMALMQAGLVGQLVTLPGLYAKMCDWLRLNLIGNPERYYIDPVSKQAQQAAQGQAQAQQQAAQQQTQMIVGIEQLKAETDRYKVDQETAWRYYDTTMDTNAKLAGQETEGMSNAIAARANAEASRRSDDGDNGGASKSNGRGGNSRSGGGSKSGRGGAGSRTAKGD